MWNLIDVDSTAEAEMHATILAPQIRDSGIGYSLTFRLLNPQIKDDVMNAFIEIFKQELGGPGWDLFVHGEGFDQVIVNITKI